MPEPLDIADMLVSTVAAIDTATSVADATHAEGAAVRPIVHQTRLREVAAAQALTDRDDRVPVGVGALHEAAVAAHDLVAPVPWWS